MITIKNDAISSVELGTIFEEVSIYSSVETSSGESNEMSESFSLEIEPDQDVFEELEIEPDQLFEVLSESYSEEGLITLLKGWLAATDPEYVMEIQKKADEKAETYKMMYLCLMTDLSVLVKNNERLHIKREEETQVFPSGGKL